MFRLDKVLEWKERLEEEARAARLAIEARATELSREADGLRAERHRFPDDAAGEDALEDLRAWSRRAELLRRAERGVRARLDAMQGPIALARAAHLSARREVDSLRRLRDRRLREQRRMRERKLQEVIDDAAARRFLPGSGRKFPERPYEPDSRGPSAPGPRPDAGFSSAVR